MRFSLPMVPDARGNLDVCLLRVFSPNERGICVLVPQRECMSTFVLATLSHSTLTTIHMASSILHFGCSQRHTHRCPGKMSRRQAACLSEWKIFFGEQYRRIGANVLTCYFDRAGGAFAFICCLCAWWIFMYVSRDCLHPDVRH